MADYKSKHSGQIIDDAIDKINSGVIEESVEQIRTFSKEAKSAAENALLSEQDAALAAQQTVGAVEHYPKIQDNHWFVWDVINGIFVDTGVVAEGKTPTRGVDYWTDSDKQEIVQSVLTALPKWEGGIF